MQTLSRKKPAQGQGQGQAWIIIEAECVFCAKGAGKFHGGAEEVSRGTTWEVQVSESDEDDDDVFVCVWS